MHIKQIDNQCLMLVMTNLELLIQSTSHLYYIPILMPARMIGF